METWELPTTAIFLPYGLGNRARQSARKERNKAKTQLNSSGEERGLSVYLKNARPGCCQFLGSMRPLGVPSQFNRSDLQPGLNSTETEAGKTHIKPCLCNDVENRKDELDLQY